MVALPDENDHSCTSRIDQFRQDKRICKLLLPCPDGAPPYLTPFLLNACFPSETHQHLVFGLSMADCCIVPVYGTTEILPKNDDITPTSKRQMRKLERKRAIEEKKPTKEADHKKKPTGYEFKGRPLESHFVMPSNYNSMILPTFDMDPEPMTSNAKGITLMTSHGRQSLTPSEFLGVLGGLQTASSCVCMYDDSTKNRELAVDRTADFVTECHQWLDHNDYAPATKVWTPVVGGPDLRYREKSIKYALNLGESFGASRFAGLALIGIHRCEEASYLLQYCTSMIPSTTPVAVLATTDLEQVLECMAKGVDVVGSDLPLNLAKSHIALCLDLNMDDKNEIPPPSKRARLEVKSNWTLEMSNLDYSGDTRLLSDSCECYTCQNKHTRAYIQHLVTVKELLGEILLFLHNLNQMLNLFQVFNNALQENRETQFFQLLKDQLQSTKTLH